ncbi:MAG: hypothetical protein ABF477_07500 [Leuconostoc pseudomesenteroides]|uniref:hypothetical protein n=1 Tax=Leuconostoc pseudomesenteroides TaxID=33968 RepID=UPI0039EB3115
MENRLEFNQYRIGTGKIQKDKFVIKLMFNDLGCTEILEQASDELKRAILNSKPVIFINSRSQPILLQAKKVSDNIYIKNNLSDY